MGLRGISLITLIITILIMVILTGAVVLSFSDNNPIDMANNAVQKQVEASIIEAVEMLKGDNLLKSSLGEEITLLTQDNLNKIVNSNVTDKGYYVYNGTVYKENKLIVDADTPDFNKIQSDSEGAKVNAPKLGTGMYPVKYDDVSNGFVEVEDVKTELWYSYIAQSATTEAGGTSKWANSVTKNNEGVVTGYYVWIPRYAYKITYNDVNDKSKDGKIDVKFVDMNNKDENGDSLPEGYIIHPAFRDGSGNGFANGEWDKELSGIWVAKYEAGDASEAGFATSIVSGTSDEKYPIFLSSVKQHTYITIGDSFIVSQAIKNNINMYGLEGVDTHLIKNSEWGAVTYLAESKYGRNGTEVTINNQGKYLEATEYTEFLTGVGGDSISAERTEKSIDKVLDKNKYNGEKGRLASTTGNVYGIYDMSGGAWERTAGYALTGTLNILYYGKIMSDENNDKVVDTFSTKYKSVYNGSTTTLDEKAKEKYVKIYNDLTDAEKNQVRYSLAYENYNAGNNKERIGEAIWETSNPTETLVVKSWNNAYSYFSHADHPFLYRGGNYKYGSYAGLYSFNRSYGNAYSYYSFRMCLAPCY